MRIENQAKPSNITYLDGKPTKKDMSDYIYLDIQIMELYSQLGAEEVIQYLKGKIKLIKQMEGQVK